MDFLVIGAQKAGTTTLHLLLAEHPQLWLPPEKEAPFFTDSGTWPTFTAFMEDVYGAAPPDVLLGGVSPQCMRGAPGVPTEMVAARMAKALPRVRLVALLRDPIERAVSEWRMAVRRGQEHRTFNQAASDLLHPTALSEARANPQPTTTYLSQGEYGRILSSWFELFPRDQFLVLSFHRLVTDQLATALEVHAFLGVDPVPPASISHAHKSGSRDSGGGARR